MARAEWRRLGALSATLMVAALGGGCSSGATAPATPTTLPTPASTPTPAPTPTPKPSPTAEPSKNGITVAVFQWPKESKCQRHVQPTGTEDLRVGCSIEVRAEARDDKGSPVPQRVSGTDTEWHTIKGKGNVTFKWDENPWRRWVTAEVPGPYIITVTIHLRNGDAATGLLEGQVVP